MRSRPNAGSVSWALGCGEFVLNKSALDAGKSALALTQRIGAELDPETVRDAIVSTGEDCQSCQADEQLREACERALAFLECLPDHMRSLDAQETREQLEAALGLVNRHA